jgi:hypothetical protein
VGGGEGEGGVSGRGNEGEGWEGDGEMRRTFGGEYRGA